MGYAYATKIGVSRQATLLDDSVLRLVRDDSCRILSNSLTADEAETTLTARLRAYLNLVNSLGRDKRLPSEIEQTLTHAGEPLSAAIRAMRDIKGYRVGCKRIRNDRSIRDAPSKAKMTMTNENTADSLTCSMN